ncbi:MAG: GNAT family N-acetyltransferase, partial [Geobacteraceae bacterium]|nr:GNAT family N-acetyltransferase [Geobacteraceae bacterium]
LFGASDPAQRDTPTGTAVLWDAFFHFAVMGLTEVDLEGVNSPKRGWFKLSFGGDLKPYFQVSK